MKRIHAFVISWRGHDDAARGIAEQLAPHVQGLTIVHSTPQLSPAGAQGLWIEMPESAYFGPKFKTCLDHFNGDILLQIQADATCADWRSLVERCRLRFERLDRLSVWSPVIQHSPWPLDAVEIRRISPDVALVAQSDGIVWALGTDAVDRMKQFDYEDNNLGWGLDWAAISHAYSKGRWAVCDLTVLVRHPQSTGYDTREAMRQMELFLQQLAPAEAEQYRQLRSYVQLKSRLSRVLGSRSG